MEVSIVIKLQDGTTKTIDLTNVNMNTGWHSMHVPTVDPAVQEFALVGTLSLQGQVKNPNLVGSL